MNLNYIQKLYDRNYEMEPLYKLRTTETDKELHPITIRKEMPYARTIRVGITTLINFSNTMYNELIKIPKVNSLEGIFFGKPEDDNGMIQIIKSYHR